MLYTDQPYKFKLQEKYLKPGYWSAPPSYSMTVQIDKNQAIKTTSMGKEGSGCPLCGAGYVFTCYCGFIEVLS